MSNKSSKESIISKEDKRGDRDDAELHRHRSRHHKNDSRSRSRSRSRSKERRKKRKDKGSHSHRDRNRDRDRDRDRDRRDRTDRKEKKRKDKDKDKKRDTEKDKNKNKPKTEKKKTKNTDKPKYKIPTNASDMMIEVILNDRLGKKIRVKCNTDDTIGDLKKLAAVQTGTRPEKIRLQKWYNVYKDHITLDDYEIKDGMGLELYYD